VGDERAGAGYKQSHCGLIVSGMQQKESHQKQGLRDIDVKYHAHTNLVVVVGAEIVYAADNQQQSEDGDI